MVENRFEKIFVDSAPFIYFFDGEKKESIKSRDMFFKYLDDKKNIVTSYITDIEIKVHPKRNGSIKKLMLMDQFFTEFNIDKLMISKKAYDIALDIRSIYNYNLIDSLQLAIAEDNNCDVFVTSDKELLSYKGLNVELI